MASKSIFQVALPALWLGGILAVLAASAAESLRADERFQPQSQRATDEPTMMSSDQRAGLNAPAMADPSPAAILARGKSLFLRQCAICHGEAGDGTGQFAYLMNPRPRNIQKGKFKLTTTQNLIPTDDDLLRTISRGMPGSAMPPWGHLPLADLKALVSFVRQIHIDAARAEVEQEITQGTFTREEAASTLASRTEPGAAIVIPPEPAFDDLRWFNGRRVYVEACAACHGIDGHPVPENVKFDDDGYPDPPRSFVNGVFKGGMEGPQLYCRIMKGMRGTPMPASEGNYTSDEFWDLIHYVQSLARHGSQDRAQLRQATIVAPGIQGPLPGGPKDSAWSQARPQYVAMTPLWWTDDHIEGVVVQALHNDQDLALRMTWLDSTQDDRAVRVDEFRDAVAIQFSLSSDPPFYMGDKTQHGGVNIWMWKADRQRNISGGYQDVDAAFPNRVTDMYDQCPIRSKDMSNVDWPHGAITEHQPMFITAWGAGNLVADPNLKTPVECLVARGPGTLAGRPANVQLVTGEAVYERGTWTVQLQRTLERVSDRRGADTAADERVFRPGDYLPISIAIWNGSGGDRDGKKSITIWQKLVIE